MHNCIVREAMFSLDQNIWRSSITLEAKLRLYNTCILVRAFVVCKVDYCISVLAGVSGNLQNRLQSVLNAAARLYVQLGSQST